VNLSPHGNARERAGAETGRNPANGGRDRCSWSCRARPWPAA